MAEIGQLADWVGRPIEALIVDDSAASRTVAQKALEVRGHRTQTAATGADTLIAIHAHDFDVVVLDLGLPDMDGLQVCRQIREVSDAYIVMLTGRTEEIDRIIGLSLGADDYVGKPFSPLELAMRIETMMRRPRSVVDDALVVGDLKMSRSTRHITVAGSPIKLTKIEFALLERLLLKQGAVATRGELSDATWGPDSERGDHLISVHMANLRKKIGSDQIEIETVRGIGYRLSDAGALH